MVPRHLSEIPISSYGMTTPNSSNGSSNLPSPVPCRPLSPVPSPNVPRWLPTCCIPSCWLVSSILWYVRNGFYSPKEDEESIDSLSLVGDYLDFENFSKSHLSNFFLRIHSLLYVFRSPMPSGRRTDSFRIQPLIHCGVRVLSIWRDLVQFTWLVVSQPWLLPSS